MTLFQVQAIGHLWGWSSGRYEGSCVSKESERMNERPKIIIVFYYLYNSFFIIADLYSIGLIVSLSYREMIIWQSTFIIYLLMT